MRRDLPELVRQLRMIKGLQSLSITTNGILLKQQARALAEAGLTRVNVSLDSLLREKFSRLTRRDQMDRIIERLEEIEQYPDIHPIKINAVAIRNFGEVGFINPVSEPFCAACDRIRLTADGQLRTCLFATTETDLRAVVRSGGDDEMLAQVLRRAVWHKELKHYIGDTRFKRAGRSMSMIGG